MSSTINTIKRKLDDGTIQEVFPRTPQQAVFNVDTGETLDDTIFGLANEISLVGVLAQYKLDIDGNNLSLIRPITEETVSTVTIPSGGGGGTGDVPREEFDNLEQRVDVLEEDVTNLKERVDSLEENAPSNPEFETHIAAKDNPHEVTKLQVGLGNVDDTSDQSKVNEGPIHDALELKADKTDLDTKADKTELESKADKEDLDKKADKDDLTNITTTLNTKVDSVKIGDTEYKTGTTVTLPVYTSSEVDGSFGASLELNLDRTNYKMTLALKDKNGNKLSNEEIDFPIESMIVDASYEDGTLSLYIVDKEEPLEVDISSIVSGLVPDTRTIAGIDLKDNITDTELVNALKDKIKDVLTIPTISASAEANGGDKIGSITINGNTTEFYAPIDKDTITTVTTTGSGNAVTNITATNGALTVTKGKNFIETETELSKGTAAGTATTLTHGGKFKAITKIAVSGHTITDTETEFTLPSETQLSKGTTTGSGNAVTDISVSNHQITLTKGKTFLEAHPTISTSTDTTSTETATHGGTIAMVDSVTRDSNGHVTKINTKTVTLPSDAKVTQTNTTTAADYRVLLSNSANDTTETNGARKSTNFTANPSTGAFFAKGFDRIDITGQTLDLNTLTLSEGSPEKMSYIEKTDGGASNITNIPVTGRPFILDVELVRWAGITDYITKQTFSTSAKPNSEYVRWCNKGTWGNWTERIFTDTNTKVTETLVSDNKEYPLLTTPAGQTATATTTSCFDSGVTLNPSTNTISASRLTTDKVSTTWLAGNQGEAIINSTANAGSYVALDKLNSTNGYFCDSVHQGARYLTYTDKTNVTENKNQCTHTITLLNESGNTSFPGTVTAPTFSGTATKVQSTVQNPTSETWYNPVFCNSGQTTGSKSLYGNNALSVGFNAGTTSAEGRMTLVLGNSTATGTDGNQRGCLRLYDKNSYYVNLYYGNGTATASRNIYLPNAEGTLALNTTATTSANGLMSSTDKTKLNATNIAYGTCSTAAATAAKVITISGNTNWTLAAGSMITIKFSATNSAQNPTFNVNNTGAKSVWYNTSAITTSNLGYAGTANRPMNFIYDGTQYVFIGWSLDNNSTNTTGTTNKVDTQLYLAGATSQASAPTTYSNVNVYIGTDNCLYSNGKKVSVDEHTHNYAGSTSAGGAANSVKTNLTVKLNGGSTEGTNLFTFNGSTAKTINITPSAIGAATSSHSHDAATTSANGFMSSTDKAKLDNTNIAYATCSTEAATAAKVATIDGNSNWTLKKGSEIIVKYTNTNSASSCTLNVNNTGAKSLWYDRAVYTGNSSIVCGYANRYIRYVYDGTNWIWMGSSADSNTTYSNFVKSGSGAKAGLVPAPSTTAGTTKYLREDGTWQVPPTSSTSVVNNLTSTSTTAALSAYQGNVLNSAISKLRMHTYWLAENKSIPGTTNAPSSSYTNTNNRKFSDYDMILVTLGDADYHIYAVEYIPMVLFTNSNYICYISYWSGSAATSPAVQIIPIGDTGFQGRSLNGVAATMSLYGVKIDGVAF